MKNIKSDEKYKRQNLRQVKIDNKTNNHKLYININYNDLQ